MATKRDIAALKAELKGMTKKERKAYQREINRIERIEQAKHRKVRRVIGWTSFITVAAVAVAGAGWWGYTAHRRELPRASGHALGWNRIRVHAVLQQQHRHGEHH